MTPIRNPHGLSLVEVVAATLVVAILALALGSVGDAVLRSHRAARDEGVVIRLGAGLLEEIASLPFTDPDTTTTALGPEPGEWDPPRSRIHFDDLDDYVAWTGTEPLQSKSGVKSGEPYRRHVRVERVDSLAVTAGTITDTDHRRITVEVRDAGGVALGRFQTVRTRGGRRVDLTW